MHDPKFHFFVTKAPPYIAHLHSPKSITSKCNTKLQSINVKCHPNNEECKTKIHNLQTTNNIKNRKERMEFLWLPSSFMMINRLVFWHFLLDQTCATLHPLGHIFIPPKVWKNMEVRKDGWIHGKLAFWELFQEDVSTTYKVKLQYILWFD